MKRKDVEIYVDEYGNYPNRTVAFSLDPQALIEIDRMIESGEYKTRSDFFRDAVYSFLCIKKQEKLSPSKKSK